MEIGQIFELKYKIVKILGAGGMSTVYLAENINLHSCFAIKEVSKGQGGNIDLLAEPLILTRLKHIALPKIFDIVENDEYLYIIEEYIEGSPLDKELGKSKRFKEETVVRWAKEICDLLQYLHSRKPHPIIYRDMKPSNLMINGEGQIKLVDFGIAREFKKGSIGDTTSMGTRGYAAPEQYGSTQTDVRTDIYGLGVTLYHLITGKSPTDQPFEIRPVREFDQTLSIGIEYIIKKCTQADPEKRYQTMEELILDISIIHEFDIEFKKARFRYRIPITASALLIVSCLFLTGFGYLEMDKESSTRYYATIQEGKALVESRNSEEAIAAFESAIAQKPDWIEAYKEIAKLYLTEGSFEECKVYIEQQILPAFETASEDPDIPYLLGTANFGLKDYTSAIDNFDDAVKIDPLNVNYSRDLASSYARQGSIAKAEDILQKLTSDSDKWDTVAYINGEISLKKGNTTAAAASFQECIAKTNDDVLKRRAYITEAQLYKDSSDFAQEAAILENASTVLVFKNDPVITEMLGEAYFSKGLKAGSSSATFIKDMDKGASCFEKLLSSGYKRPYIYRNIGIIYHYTGEYDKSKNILQEMAAAYPTDFRPYYELALLYADIENTKPNESRDYNKTFANYEAAMKYSTDEDKQSEMVPLINLVGELKSKGWD